MKRREMLRASVLAGAAAALCPTLASAQSAAKNVAQPSELTPAQSGVDASKEFEGPGWKPLFLDKFPCRTCRGIGSGRRF